MEDFFSLILENVKKCCVDLDSNGIWDGDPE